MALPRQSIRKFLVQAKASLKNAIQNGQKVTLVIGNESSDLDSLTSSLLFAYVRSSAPPKNAFTPLYVPITNLRAEDIQIRPEYLALLPHAHLDAKSLITLDDLPNPDVLESRLPSENTRWILVDHNALQGVLGKIYGQRVIGTIDHHVDEQEVPVDTGDEPRIITKTGSCSSLVANNCRKTWDSLSPATTSSSADDRLVERHLDDADSPLEWDAQVAKLAIASILIDTNDTKSEGKTTTHDIQAVDYLMNKILSSRYRDFDRSSFFKEINEAKRDIGHLNSRDILRKDYKEWTQGDLKLGVSCVVKSVDFLVEKGRAEGDNAPGAESSAPFLKLAKQFAENRGLDIYSIMTTSTSTSGDFQRELIVWALNSNSIPVGKLFEQQAADELGLKAWHGSAKGLAELDSRDEWRKIWQQTELQHSRKRVAPLLRQAMN